MIQVKRKEKETSESMLRRFSRRVHQSGVLKRARKIRFKNDEKSKSERRNEAIYKTKIRKEIDRAKKFGSFDDDSLKEIKKKMNRS
ncbi:MAG: hypothetical protein HGA31_04075 [Candidatus Moranbacteria bacterium]|nr:hypothetical protein [Candidatus Moranbacteria bacterium]